MPHRKRGVAAMTRREILQGIRRIQKDPEIADLEPSIGDAMVIFLIESNKATVDYIMSEVAKAIENDPRTNFIYAFLKTAWQVINEFSKLFGNFLKEWNTTKKRG